MADDARALLYVKLSTSLDDMFGPAEITKVALAPLIDPGADIDGLASCTMPTNQAPVTAVPLLGLPPATRSPSQTDIKMLEDKVKQEASALARTYSLAALEDSADVHGWKEVVYSILHTAMPCSHPNAMFRAILAEMVASHLNPTDVPPVRLHEVRARIRLLGNTPGPYTATDPPAKVGPALWEPLVECLKPLESIRASAHVHVSLRVQQSAGESVVSYLRRAITRTMAVQEVQTHVPVDQSYLSQIISGVLEQSTRVSLSERLNSANVKSFSALAERFDTLEQTIFAGSELYEQGEHILAPFSAEETVNALMKRSRPANLVTCYRCKENGHWASYCIADKTVSALDCGRCGHQHGPQQCPVTTPVTCGRFGCQEDHLASHCPRKLVLTDNGKPIAVQALNRAKRARADVNVVDISDIPKGSLMKPLNYSVVEFLSFSDLQCRRDLRMLIDGGSSINVLPADFVQKLRYDPEFDLPASRIGKLIHKPIVTFANGDSETVTTYVELLVRVDNANYLIPFHVLSSGSKAILGQPGISLIWPGMGIKSARREHRMAAAATISPRRSLPTPVKPVYVTREIVNGKRRLVVHFPLLAAAKTHPIRTRPRDHNRTVQAIIYARLQEMVRLGQVARARSTEVSVTSPIVLVDKLKDLKRPKEFPIPESDTSRYRLTVDLRGVNKSKLFVTNEGSILVPGRLETTPESIAAWSFAPTSRQILREIDVENCQFWAKTDLTSAFDHVVLSEDMRHLFGIEALNPSTGEWEVYTWNALPQGWSLSPMFFNMAMDLIKEETRQKLGVIPGLAVQPQLKNLADDLLTAGCTAESTRQCQDTLHEVLQDNGFAVRLDKCTAPSEQTTFCGSSLNGCLVKPTATRIPIVESFADSAWADLISGRVDETHWLRRIAGHFQFLRGHLSKEMQERLSVFYEAIGTLQKDTQAVLDHSAVRKALDDLVDYACHGLPALVLAKFPEVHATLIVVDASPVSWAATVFLLATIPDCTAAQLPDTSAAVAALRKTEHFRHRPIPDNVGLVPTYIQADLFKERGASSTWYERRAQIEAVHALQPFCEGPVFVVSDNANSGKTWHDIDESFGGTAFAKLQHFQANVSGILWQQRDGLPSMPDALARIVDACRPQRDASLATPIPTATPAVTTAATTPVVDTPSGEQKRHRKKKNKSKNKTSGPRGTITAAVDATPPLPFPAELTTFLDAVKSHYHKDSTQFLPSVPMSRVFAILNKTPPPTGRSRLEELVHRRFRLTDGFVYLCSPSVADRLYIPQFNSTFSSTGTLRNSRGFLIDHFHSATGPHLGITRTEAELCKSFFWPQMRNDVAKFVGACITCRTVKATHRPPSGTLSSTVVQADKPFATLLMDFASIPRSTDHFLLVLDAFSHHAWAFRTKDQTAETVRRVLLELFMSVSVPARIHSDRGKHFEAASVAEFAASLGVQLTFSPTALPRAQGAAEIAVKSLKTMIATTLAHRKSAQSMDLVLRTAVQTHNATTHVRLGLSPAEVFFGFRPTLPGKWPPTPTSEEGRTPDELATIRDATRTIWRVRRDEYIAKFQDEYFLRSRDNAIQLGDLVQYQPPKISPGATYPDPRGIFRVMERAGTNTWYLSKDSWTPQNPLTDRNTARGDIAPEIHLVRFIPAAQLRLGLDTPAPPPEPPSRPTTRSRATPTPRGGGGNANV
jgi:transposase InsO family protein